VRPRLLAVGWVLVAGLSVLLLVIGLAKWRSFSSEMVRARAERERLTAEIQLREQQLVAEMRTHAQLLQEMQWTASGTDPSAFLTRMAELAQEKRMKVMAIGPREQQSSPQFNKSWHAVQIQAPYREIRELATRIEREKGILEDVHLEAAPSQPGGPAGAPGSRDEIQARFRMTALELSPQAKLVIDRARAATGTQVPPGSPLALSVPTGSAQSGTSGRDPFSFLTPPPGPARAAGGPPATVAEGPSPLVPLEVKGIVSFPDGFLAIVNNQIVKVGDTVSGHRVERITDSSVTLREPGATGRTVSLPDLAPAPPAESRR
jgi:hypothetical protein